MTTQSIAGDAVLANASASVLGEQLTAMESNRSPFEQAVRAEKLNPISAFQKKGHISPVSFQDANQKLGKGLDAAVKENFPKLTQAQNGDLLEATPSFRKANGKRVAVLFSGGPASGGHNVILGIWDALGKENTLFGVIAGPKGLLSGKLIEISRDDIAARQNLGGFDFLGSDRTKIKSPEQFEHVRATVRKFELDAIIIVGGDDSNTNAATLAEYLMPEHCTVVGVPKTIDGDLQVGRYLPISFGFDTATKIYAELAGNILQDTPSSRKYWHFIKLMGRSASQVTLEVALQTKPAIALISEEIAARKMSLGQIVEEIAFVVAKRAAKGINHGVVLVPEGLIEFIPEFNGLIRELNELLAAHQDEMLNLTLQPKLDFLQKRLSKSSAVLLGSLPLEFAERLFLDRDSHGNLAVSQINTEELLAKMVASKIAEFQASLAQYFGPGKAQLSKEELGKFSTYSFKTITHFFGYEGRCGAPTRFDADFTYNLGLVAGALALEGKTGYMAAVTDFDKGGRAFAIPLTALITAERRSGKTSMVIQKALVDLDAPAFQYFQARREAWAQNDCFASPGPRQLWGKAAYQLPILVALNQGYSSLSYSFSAEKGA